MIAPCSHRNSKRFGKTKSGEQRFRCLDCGKTYTDSTRRLAGMRIGSEKAAQIISMLCEGVSVRATSRLTDTDLHTILDLLVLVGTRCKQFLDRELVGVLVDDIQVDEVWQFIFCKERTAERNGWAGAPVGDSYCFTAVERTTKLAVAWHLGRRSPEDTDRFCGKLRTATNGRFQNFDRWIRTLQNVCSSPPWGRGRLRRDREGIR
jgi:transposase-like protein